MIFGGGGGVVSRARRPPLGVGARCGGCGGGSWFRTNLGIGFWGDSIRSLVCEVLVLVFLDFLVLGRCGNG